MSLLIVGLSHRTAPVSVLELATVPSADLTKLLEELAGPHRLQDIDIAVSADGAQPRPTCARNPALLYGLRNLVENAMSFARAEVRMHLEQIGDDIGASIDKRRFRANIYLNLNAEGGFSEDQFVGHTLRIGEKVVLAIIDRDPRCKMITLDPDTAEPNPDVMKRVARAYDGKAGIYAAVLVEGTIRSGDEIRLLN